METDNNSHRSERGRIKNFPDTGQRRFANFDTVVGSHEATQYRADQIEILKAEREAEARANVADVYDPYRTN